MSEMKRLSIGGQTYRVRDENAVAYDMPQNLTQQQQLLARENIGANTLIVQVVDDRCTHTARQIYQHIAQGGSCLLLDGELYYGLQLACWDQVIFAYLTDDHYCSQWRVLEDGSAEFTELEYASGHLVAQKMNRPSTAQLGQTVRVSYVDGAGAPVNWQAADWPVLDTYFWYDEEAGGYRCDDYTAQQLVEALRAGTIIQGRFFSNEDDLQFSAIGHIWGRDRSDSGLDEIHFADPDGSGSWLHRPADPDFMVDGDGENATAANELWRQTG